MYNDYLSYNCVSLDLPLNKCKTLKQITDVAAKNYIQKFCMFSPCVCSVFIIITCNISSPHEALVLSRIMLLHENKVWPHKSRTRNTIKNKVYYYWWGNSVLAFIHILGESVHLVLAEVMTRCLRHFLTVISCKSDGCDNHCRTESLKYLNKLTDLLMAY